MKKWIVIVALIIVISVVAGVIFGIRRNAAKESSRAQAELGEWRRDPETNLPIFDRADGKPAFVSGELIISFSDEASVRLHGNYIPLTKQARHQKKSRH